MVPVSEEDVNLVAVFEEDVDANQDQDMVIEESQVLKPVRAMNMDTNQAMTMDTQNDQALNQATAQPVTLDTQQNQALKMDTQKDLAKPLDTQIVQARTMDTNQDQATTMDTQQYQASNTNTQQDQAPTMDTQQDQITMVDTQQDDTTIMDTKQHLTGDHLGLQDIAKNDSDPQVNPDAVNGDFAQANPDLEVVPEMPEQHLRSCKGATSSDG